MAWIFAKYENLMLLLFVFSYSKLHINIKD